MAKKFNYKKSLEEINSIINNVETGNIDIDKMSSEIKRASELIKKCKSELRKTELEVKSVLEDPEDES
ncbi:MAG: exodeoxyribonuclease VII small subunit [Bacteroidota bacterium]|nr:exodeoxyribonuclease VII small subunit [Bacteroidota bacterium]